MPKPANSPKNKHSPKSLFAKTKTTKSSKLASPDAHVDTSGSQPSKQERVIAMLRSPDGATIAAMMRATGWQQHSVRGFLAGVVRKKLKLKLGSEKVDDNRIYRIDGQTLPKAEGLQQLKRRAA